MNDDALLELLAEAAGAVRHALDEVQDWGPSGVEPGQHSLDLAADAAALEVLAKAEVGVLSEESGFHHPERDVWVALDPVGWSTNAARGVPWFAATPPAPISYRQIRALLAAATPELLAEARTARAALL